jgi:hypothetical protein
MKIFCKVFSSVLIFLLAYFAFQLTAPIAAQQGNTSTPATELAHKRAHELVGFLLRQDRKAFEAVLGKPFHQQPGPNNTLAVAYRLPQVKDDYLVAFLVNDKKSIYDGKAIQLELTGEKPSGPTGFFGLQLGDSAEKVEAVLGKPDKITHEDDVNLDLWDWYLKFNYSLEFSADHTLYSIQINDQPSKDSPVIGGRREAREYALAIQTHDIDKVMEMSSGEIECNDKEAFGIQGGKARAILSDNKSPISICLQKAAAAILASGPEMKGYDDSLRMWEKGPPGSVTKPPASSPLREVVFFEEAGAIRVYEVTFR